MLNLLKRFMVPLLVGFTLITQAVAADLHSGGTSADVIAIKKAVSAEVRYPITDWFVAVKGGYAVAQFAEGPAAGGTYGVVKRGSNWRVTCKQSSKGMFGSCEMPAGVYESLTKQTNQLMMKQ